MFTSADASCLRALVESRGAREERVGDHGAAAAAAAAATEATRWTSCRSRREAVLVSASRVACAWEEAGRLRLAEEAPRAVERLRGRVREAMAEAADVAREMELVERRVVTLADTAGLGAGHDAGGSPHNDTALGNTGVWDESPQRWAIKRQRTEDDAETNERVRTLVRTFVESVKRETARMRLVVDMLRRALGDNPPRDDVPNSSEDVVVVPATAVASTLSMDAPLPAHLGSVADVAPIAAVVLTSSSTVYTTSAEF